MKALIEKIIDDVCCSADISKQVIISSRRAEPTAARHLCFRLLTESGISTERIAGYFGVSTRAVTLANTAFNSRIERTPYLMRIYCELKAK
jgi:hypothetical protein